jgi:hypothetical protein
VIPGIVLQKTFELLASRKLALGLLGIVCLMSVPGTFAETKEFYSSSAFVAALGALALNLLVCTVKRIRTLAKSVAIIHIGVIVTLAGAAVSARGYVATVNAYEGTSFDSAYRWDRKEEMSLGADVEVKEIGMEYYPVPIKVGVLRNKEKEGLFVLKTGERFTLGPYQVSADELDAPSRNLHLSVFRQGHSVGAFETAGVNALPEGFPYTFVLVAYKNPVSKRAWVSLSVSREGRVLAEGKTEANDPFEWGGLSFHNTEIGYDVYGNRYAGIQIARDPGRPLVFAGFAIVCFGAAVYMIRRMYGLR